MKKTIAFIYNLNLLRITALAIGGTLCVVFCTSFLLCEQEVEETSNENIELIAFSETSQIRKESRKEINKPELNPAIKALEKNIQCSQQKLKIHLYILYQQFLIDRCNGMLLRA